MPAERRVAHSRRTLYSWGAAEPNPTAQVRRRLHKALSGLGVPPDTLQDALVMATELTANAHCHAITPCRVVLVLTQAAILVEVHDSDPRHPPASVGRAGPAIATGGGAELGDPILALAESGRGLQVVNALSRGRWGFRADLRGKAAWFALTRGALPDGPAVSRLGSDTTSKNTPATTPAVRSAAHYGSGRLESRAAKAFNEHLRFR
ncbi:ATP-binding protein [Kitasatospora azatica]|uniref:ATP-binding protein n=1 Tax=Kitasatospora azatica TaxID=58347 RepID=UPI00068F2AF7|nr:ATP-binding protein [Kitasatospora azatica]